LLTLYWYYLKHARFCFWIFETTSLWMFGWCQQGRDEVRCRQGQETILAPPPMFEAEVFWKQMYCIEESTCDIVGTFRPRDSSPRVLCPPSPLVTPLGATHHHQQCCSSQQGFVVLLQIALQSKSQPLHSVYSFPAFVLSLINEIPCRSVALLCEWYEPELPAFAYVEQACFWAFRELFRGSDWIGVSWFFFNPAK